MSTSKTRRLAALGAAAALAVTLAGPLGATGATAIPINATCDATREPSPRSSYLTYDQLVRDLQQLERTSQGRIAVEVAGQSNQGRDIFTARVGHGDTVVLINTQIHGNEPHGTEAIMEVLKTVGGNSRAAREIRDAVTIVVVPRLNVDGTENNTRQNDMTWDDVVRDFPQLAGSAPAWNYNRNVGGFDVNRDFNPNLDYVPQPGDFPGNSASVGWYMTPEGQTLRDVYRDLENEFGLVDYFLDLHGQATCYLTEGTDRISLLSLSGRFIADPAQHGDWPNYDYDASRAANLAIYNALQSRGNSTFGDITLYPQNINLPGTALGTFALRGSATVLFETSSQTQFRNNQQRNGLLIKQVEDGVMGLLNAITDGSINNLDPNDYDNIPNRLPFPRN